MVRELGLAVAAGPFPRASAGSPPRAGWATEPRSRCNRASENRGAHRAVPPAASAALGELGKAAGSEAVASAAAVGAAAYAAATALGSAAAGRSAAQVGAVVRAAGGAPVGAGAARAWGCGVGAASGAFCGVVSPGSPALESRTESWPEVPAMPYTTLKPVQPEQVNLNLNLVPGAVSAIAREARHRCSDSQWATLVGFALQVVLLEEGLHQEAEYWVAPRE